MELELELAELREPHEEMMVLTGSSHHLFIYSFNKCSMSTICHILGLGAMAGNEQIFSGKCRDGSWGDFINK